MITRSRFNGAVDLAAMQQLVCERTRVMGPCTNLHPGDLAHRIYSGLRGRDPGDVVPVWRDARGIVAFGIIWRGEHSFDFVSRVDVGSGVVAAAVTEIADLAASKDVVATAVIGDDIQMSALLTDLGFVAGPEDYVLTEAPLDPLRQAERHAFTIRSVSFADTEQLAAVHSGAFGSGWSAGNYEERMRKPGYDPRDEIVAVDPTGRFMGFAVMWYDEVNRVGHFEPVGVRSDFHRRGIGSALLREGLKRMEHAGMETATVWHAGADEGAAGFYGSNGFVAVNSATRWERTRAYRQLLP